MHTRQNVYQARQIPIPLDRLTTFLYGYTTTYNLNITHFRNINTQT